MLYSLLLSMFFIALGLVSYLTTHDSLPTVPSKATSAYTLQSNVLTSASAYRVSTASVNFDLASQGKQQGLYRLEDTSAQAVLDFIALKPVFSLSGTGSNQRLIPDDKKNMRLKLSVTDKELNNQFLGFGLETLDTGSSHFFFDQTRCGNVPIFGSYLNVHVGESAHVYAISGALTKGETRCQKNISTEEAQGRAQTLFAEKYGSEGLYFQETNEYVWSPQVFSEAGPVNYLTQYTVVCQAGYCRGYFVDLGDGTVRYEHQVSTDAKNRYVYLGNAQRREGSSPVSNPEVNKAYDIMGTVWDYYNNSHQRDSYNNAGGLIQVRLQSCNQVQASWNGREIFACTGVNETDVLAHEFQHGVTQHTAGLVYQNESGALNESLSDIFGAVIDSDDWLMGEEGVRAIRSLQNPPQFGHPDSMVSSKFYCGSQDNGGVHINSGVLNKAFYLMSDGGSFNGCTINGLGREKAVQAVYKALTTYMKGKRNGTFKDMYNAINLGCNDVYGSGSAECANIKAAMEATYMDKPSRCKGGSAGQTTCSGDQPPVPSTTVTPAPTGQTTPVPTGGTTPAPTSGTTPAPTATPAPTQGPKVLREAPLLSTLSSPKFVSGDVTISQSGSQVNILSELQAASLTDLNLENLGVQSLDDIVLEIRGRLIGEDVLETGAFVIRGDKILNDFTTDADVSGYHTYQVYFEKTDDYEELPVLIANLIPQEETPPASEESVILDLKLRFQGIDRQPPATQAQLVRVGLSGGDIDKTIYKKAVFTPNADGVWTGRVVYKGVSELSDGAVRIKGSKHIQKKYCHNKPKESGPGFYVCENEGIVLREGVNTLDFTGVMQLAGDINQDGRVNAVDINVVRSSLGSTAADDLVFGDMNNDGVINSIDDGLNIFTLSNRPEQN